MEAKVLKGKEYLKSATAPYYEETPNHILNLFLHVADSIKVGNWRLDIGHLGIPAMQ